MPKNDVIDLYTKLNDCADYNINNNEALADYYTQAKENMNGTFAKIEDEILTIPSSRTNSSLSTKVTLTIREVMKKSSKTEGKTVS